MLLLSTKEAAKSAPTKKERATLSWNSHKPGGGSFGLDTVSIPRNCNERLLEITSWDISNLLNRVRVLRVLIGYFRVHIR